MGKILGVIAALAVLLGLVATTKGKQGKELWEPCKFSVDGEENWYTDDDAFKPGVEAELAAKMDELIPTRTTWTSATLVEATMKTYDPECSFAAASEWIESAKDFVTTELYVGARMQVDLVYALGQQRLNAAT